MSLKEQTAYLQKTSIKRVPVTRNPVGLIELAAFCRQEIPGISIGLLDFPMALVHQHKNYASTPPMMPLDFVCMQLNQWQETPDIVGISILYSSSYNSSMMIVSEIRKKWPNSTIIIGGNHATNYVHHMFKHPDVDFVFCGEAELSLVEFIKMFNDKERLALIQGVYDRNKAASNINETGHMLQDMDQIPIASYDLIDMDHFSNGGNTVSVMLARGCPFKCTFCASFSVHGSKIREKSNKRIIQELQYLRDRYGVVGIVLEDDLIAAHKRKFIELSKFLISMEFVVVLANGLSIAVMDEELIDTMISLKVNMFNFAIESGSEYTQKHLIKKNVNLKKARRLLNYARSKDQQVMLNYILGFPEETRELMDESIDYLCSLDFDWVFVFTALPLPGSEMFKQFVAMGCINEDDFDWDSCRHGLRTFDTNTISAKELEELVYDINVKVNFFNNCNIRDGKFEKAIQRYNELLHSYPFHIVARYMRGIAYLGLSQDSSAEADFKDCVYWLQKDEESSRLFKKYGDQMPMLAQFLKMENHF